MDLFRVFDIAGSGMGAQSVRLNTTASNLANINSVSGDPEQAYRARHPMFETIMQGFGDEASAGVRVLGVVEDATVPQPVYEPGHPEANEAGYIYRGNVDLATEMTNMISASRAYQNNVEILNTSKDLMLRTLSLGRQ
ncbi:flagellar basal body rod protein FlgC [Chromatocurvus halotolerans]|uniref:Flagellar basal-body rod protein FlgC n=1 Tax=Chromatocurvus halotolerans TaxID=1132028 RepID=A0A4R2KS79_9GAMM|nr:flagellar basal body rod protein FlgC [Chromatocurvus halotolerans]TCO76623.1 flagellar basal-body rod protein FlgC [Chromatocurvus halotolerans]